MQNNIFRKESIDRLQSPEQLNEYIRVARPGVWIVLGAIVLILVGVIVWGIFGTAETVVHTGALVQDGVAVCYVQEADAAQMKPGMPVVIRGQSGTIGAVSTDPVLVDGGEMHPYLLELSGLTAGSYCYEVKIDISGLEDGVYAADITVESIKPIAFVTQ